MKVTIRQFPESVVSRPVIQADVARVMETAPIMQRLLLPTRMNPHGGVALAHVQVVDKDPLRFFVHEGVAIINPVIVRHTRHTVPKEEACLSYCTKQQKLVDRYDVIEVKYQRIVDGKLYEPIFEDAKGEYAQIFQHEIEHFDGLNIYNAE